MELFTKYTFALFWLFVAVYLTFLDKKYPEAAPTNNIVFRLIWWYIAFVFAWPEYVGKALNKWVSKLSDFTVWFKKDV